GVRAMPTNRVELVRGVAYEVRRALAVRRRDRERALPLRDVEHLVDRELDAQAFLHDGDRVDGERHVRRDGQARRPGVLLVAGDQAQSAGGEGDEGPALPPYRRT